MANLFETGLKFYRLTIKRVRPLHQLTHLVVTRLVIPVLERRQGFRTMPDDPFWFRLELLTNKHERETTALIRQCIKPDMTMLDVGAHVGYYTRHFAQLVGETGRVLALEPHPRTFAILQDNVGRFPQVTPVRAAAAETEGTAELHDYLIMSASGSLHYDPSLAELQKSTTHAGDVAPRLSGRFAASTFTVHTMPIDSLLAEHGIEQLDAVKMDIEGAEINALQGMRQTIQRSPNLMLIMEYNPQALRAFGHVPQEALAGILSLGFTRMQIINSDSSLTDITGDTATINQLTERLMTGMDVVNLLITRD
jgi:FkbM family methyltransferase